MFFFGLSYLVRFAWDKFAAWLSNSDEDFLMSFGLPYSLGFDLVSYAEGFAFIALLLQHSYNFKQRAAASTQDTNSQLTGSVNQMQERETLLYLDKDTDSSKFNKSPSP